MTVRQDPLDLIGLRPLMSLSRGRRDIGVGLIDGPVAASHPELSEATIRAAGGTDDGGCARIDSAACGHGTFVAGILVARRASLAPAICPDCTLLVRPIFTESTSDEALPTATTLEVSDAIVETVDAGARIVNLSAATGGPSTKIEGDVRRALDHVAHRGALVVAAAGNQGTLGASAITRHPAVVPVVGYGETGRPMDQSNLGSSLGRRGIGAPGKGIVSLGAQGPPLTQTGTSFAAAFVTGAIALLWSLFPDADASAIRTALSHGAPRRTSVVPPLLTALRAHEALAGSVRSRDPGMSSSNRWTRGSVRTAVGDEETAGSLGDGVEVDLGAIASPPAQVAPPAAMPAPAAEFVYALGQVQTRMPSLAIEKEFAQAIGGPSSPGLTDRQAMSEALHEPANRYLARQLCWIFTIEGVESYILAPRDPGDLDLLVESVRPEYSRDDLDVVIGVRAGIAPPEMCNGLALPIVVFDQLYSFDRESLIAAIPRPDSVTEKKDSKFRSAAGDLFDQLIQLADNAGAIDEHRALNYLAVRYPQIYSTTVEQFDQNKSFTGVEVLPSRLSNSRSIVNVVFSYTHRDTDVTEKRFVRVDVTEEFPFLVTKMSLYYDR